MRILGIKNKTIRLIFMRLRFRSKLQRLTVSVFSVLSLTLLTLTGCHRPLNSSSNGNGIYYWRTTMSLNEKEKEFLDRHNVTRLYVRFFDVDREFTARQGEDVIPIATIAMNDSLPEGVDVIPTVYITTYAIERMQLKEEEYAEKILKRIDAMCRQKGISYSEIQLDCDWTKNTCDTFYNLCRMVKSKMDSKQSLSSTIRLHQLVQTPPPVDKGVLMVYNTGNLNEMTTENSIFSLKDIEPYLRDSRLADYELPLDIAYPTYGWSVIYRPVGGKYHFDKLLRRTDFSELPQLKKIGKNMYEVTDDVNFTPETNQWNDAYRGYRVRVERPDAREILAVKKKIEAQLKDKPHSNILYHLDEAQLSHYSNHDIDKIYYCD